jgi:hypothetical protein
MFPLRRNPPSGFFDELQAASVNVKTRIENKILFIS